MKKIILLLILCFLALSNVWGQEKEISKDEFHKSFRESNGKFFDAKISRSTSKIEYFKEGNSEKVLETITENLKPDRWRFFVIETNEKGRTVSDLIRIDKIYYCKKNKEGWKKSISGCNSGWATGLSNVVSSKYYVEVVKEQAQSFKVYREYTIYKNNYSSSKDKEGFSFWENKFWLDGNGLLTKKEIVDGLIEPKMIYSQQIEKYEYNPKDLKIEIPKISE